MVSSGCYILLLTLPLSDSDIHSDENQDHTYLGQVKRRNPDVQPYGTPFLDSLRYVHKGFAFFTKREFMFALKAGLLTCLVALPAVIRSSAHFFYYNRDKSCFLSCAP
jgi:hypothetical protein